MRLTSFTDYSVRVLVHSTIKGGELASIREVSELYDISSNHLMKIVHHLGKGGYLKTVRGKNGGFRLGKPPEDIKIGDVIRYTEDDLNIVECFDDEKTTCQLKDNCGFEKIMTQALSAFLEIADNYTLADLAENGGQFELSGNLWQ